jgi:hypothetical protein
MVMISEVDQRLLSTFVLATIQLLLTDVQAACRPVKAKRDFDQPKHCLYDFTKDSRSLRPNTKHQPVTETPVLFSQP